MKDKDASTVLKHSDWDEAADLYVLFPGLSEEKRKNNNRIGSQM